MQKDQVGDIYVDPGSNEVLLRMPDCFVVLHTFTKEESDVYWKRQVEKEEVQE